MEEGEKENVGDGTEGRFDRERVEFLAGNSKSSSVGFWARHWLDDPDETMTEMRSSQLLDALQREDRRKKIISPTRRFSAPSTLTQRMGKDRLQEFQIDEQQCRVHFQTWMESCFFFPPVAQVEFDIVANYIPSLVLEEACGVLVPLPLGEKLANLEAGFAPISISKIGQPPLEMQCHDFVDNGHGVEKEDRRLQSSLRRFCLWRPVYRIHFRFNFHHYTAIMSASGIHPIIVAVSRPYTFF